MKKFETRYTKAQKRVSLANTKLYMLEKQKEEAKKELDEYCKKHRLNFDSLATSDVEKLLKIYDYFDNGEDYIFEWQGGLRCDDRGMKLCFWVNDDCEYLTIHITSNHNNLVFSGSTSWIIKAVTLEDKVNIIKKVKEDIGNIIKE